MILKPCLSAGTSPTVTPRKVIFLKTMRNLQVWVFLIEGRNLGVFRESRNGPRSSDAQSNFEASDLVEVKKKRRPNKNLRNIC